MVAAGSISASHCPNPFVYAPDHQKAHMTIKPAAIAAPRAPGTEQNKAGYDIKVAFDPATNGIFGSEQIRYTNNSPDTLKVINFKLFPNLSRKEP